MTNRHTFPFPVSLGRSDQGRVNLQSVIGDLQNLRPVLERVHRQNTVTLPQWLQFREPVVVQGTGSNDEIQEVPERNPGSPDFVVNVQNGTSLDNNGTPIRNDAGIPPESPAAAQRPPNNPLASISVLIEQNPDLSRALKICLTSVPFLILILIKEIYEHVTGISSILVTMGLVITFIHSNNTMEREVSKQGKRELRPLFIVLFNCAACIMFVLLIYGEEELHHRLLVYPQSSTPLSFFSLLWNNMTTDYVLKLITIFLKALVTLLPSSLLPFLRRGKYFVFIETSSQLYRVFATIPPWINYLFNDHQKPPVPSEEPDMFIRDSWLFGIFLCATYLLCKGYKTWEFVKLWKTALSKLFQSTNYGSSPSAEQLQSVGATCPICHDEFKRPTCLQCRHIFCEECVAVWLDRERTCPMCRAMVAEDPCWKDGSTDPFIQFF